MEDDYILTRFHHGGTFIEQPVPIYKGELDAFVVAIDKDHFSVVELSAYAKDLGYAVVEGFYCQKEKDGDFIKVFSDFQLYEFVKDLKHGDILDVYLRHGVSQPEVVEENVGLLCGAEVGGGGNDQFKARATPGSNTNTEEPIEPPTEPTHNAAEPPIEPTLNDAKPTHNSSEPIVNPVDGDEPPDHNVNEDGVQSDVESSESEEDVLPEEDDSDVDDELRSLRAERRSKRQGKQRKKPIATDEIPLGEAGIDRGFEDIGRNKTSRYVGKLGGDEQFIDSSEADSEDSTEELDPEAIPGVDIPARRRSTKVRYDPDCEVAIFELGMIFENAIEFRKALANYAIEYKVQIKLRPNEPHRVRAKCKSKRCKWVCYACIDRDSGDFKVKNYYPVHKCDTSNKNKLCTSKFVAKKFKDEITKQPHIRIWEIQELCRDKLGLYVGKTICYRAKLRVLRESMGDWNMEFARLCDYADMIKQTNPGSSCWVRMDSETEPGKNLFVYFYVCFDALKKGWLEGCRRIIGFDGCFLKGACKGELLVVVGKNGNQQMFPIAWAVVDQETKHSWSFFINYLKDDLQLGTGEGLTVMADMQKVSILFCCLLSSLLSNFGI